MSPAGNLWSKLAWLGLILAVVISVKDILVEEFHLLLESTLAFAGLEEVPGPGAMSKCKV